MDDTTLSLRLKHGVHTIFLFFDALAPFSELTETLLQILRERYPGGLTTSVAPPRCTPLPVFDDDVEVVYAMLVNSHDASQGWKRLNIVQGDTPSKKGIKTGSILAFAFEPVDASEDDSAEFIVDWPKLDDDYEEDEEMN